MINHDFVILIGLIVRCSKASFVGKFFLTVVFDACFVRHYRGNLKEIRANYGKEEKRSYLWQCFGHSSCPFSSLLPIPYDRSFPLIQYVWIHEKRNSTCKKIFSQCQRVALQFKLIYNRKHKNIRTYIGHNVKKLKVSINNAVITMTILQSFTAQNWLKDNNHNSQK